MLFLVLNGFFVFEGWKVVDFFYFEKLRIMVLADFDQRHFGPLFSDGILSSLQRFNYYF